MISPHVPSILVLFDVAILTLTVLNLILFPKTRADTSPAQSAKSTFDNAIRHEHYLIQEYEADYAHASLLLPSGFD